MTVEHMEIVSQEDYRQGEGFGDVGPYVRIEAVAHYAVDPEAEANRGIVDIDRVPRSDDGMVRYEGDVTILRPRDAAGSARIGLVEVPNRGRRTMGSLYNRAPALLSPSEDIDPGDGLLFRSGWTMAWCGWQWDVPRSPARMGLTAPHLVNDHGEAESAQVQLRLQLSEPVTAVDLTDHHVGILGGHQPLPAADIDDSGAVLTRRRRLWSTPEEIPRERWRFARVDSPTGQGEPVPDASHVWLEGGFEPGAIYDLVYNTRPSHVAGVGLLAVRDLGAYLLPRSAAGTQPEDHPTAELLDHLVVTGQSQCGRFLRHLLHLGLNKSEAGDQVYDGVLAHIAGGRRGEFNHRGAQPSVQPTPTFGHRFPFADEPQEDSRTGLRAGLLDELRANGSMPKVFYTNTASEYWRGDASLAHTNSDDGTDVDPPPDTRHYVWSSTQHSAGLPVLASVSLMGSSAGNDFNIIDFTPLMRAALFNLRDWVVDGVEPPANAVPRLSDGSAVDRAAVLAAVDQIPGFATPEVDGLWTLRALDLGPDADAGVGTFPAVPTSDAYPCLVSNVDADGNETAGIRMPDVAVPLATHTGWNPRHPDSGAPDQILEYLGSTVPFSVDESERAKRSDPRPSITERYGDRAGYVQQVRASAENLVSSRHLLADDVETCVDIAGARWDLLAGS